MAHTLFCGIPLPQNPIPQSVTDWLQADREDTIAFRRELKKNFGIWAIPYFEIVNTARKLRLSRAPSSPKRAMTRTEKILAIGLLTFGAFSLTGNTAAMSAVVLPTSSTAFTETAAPKPTNWLSGKVTTKGSKYAVVGAFNYATTAGYTFASDDAAVETLVANGTLVKLEGQYITLSDVSQPYALEPVVMFTNRLGQQYAEQGCGKLVVTSAVRTSEVQGALANGSNFSVHPTGMSIDIRRMTTGEKGSTFCLKWLENTLKAVEEDRRIDVTFEESPRHFHVVVLPNEYEAWLKLLKASLDPEVEALATALFFEGAFQETDEGYEAIAAVIKNRVQSKYYPNSILEVVAEGAAGRSNGGCQFSFMCDGRAEDIQILCGQHPADKKDYWETLCKNRWQKVVAIAKRVINEENDPTGGATLYYAVSMNIAPYWAVSDMKHGTVQIIGGHVFACSVNRGRDVCKDKEGDKS